MSVKYYSRNKPHPGGFIGFRVAVMVAGNHKQKYFSTARSGVYDHQFRLAHKTNAKWLAEKEKGMLRFKNQAIQTSRSTHSTGVRGITKQYCYSPDRKGNSKAYKRLRYVVQIMNNYKLYHRRFPTTKQGWIDAVTFLAKVKQLTHWKHLLSR